MSKMEGDSGQPRRVSSLLPQVVIVVRGKDTPHEFVFTDTGK